MATTDPVRQAVELAHRRATLDLDQAHLNIAYHGERLSQFLDDARRLRLDLARLGTFLAELPEPELCPMAPYAGEG